MMENGFFAAFNFHTCFDSSVSVEYFLLVNDLAWFLYLRLCCLCSFVSCVYLVFSCNCRQPDKCPTEGKCLTKSVVYQAEVSTVNNEPAKYIGVTADDFKTRYRNHAKSFTNKKYSTETELSKHVWKLKAAKKPFSIIWSLLKNVPAYKAGSRRCNLCLEEKLTIMKNKNNSLLNKRSELFTKCRHETRYLISQCK